MIMMKLFARLTWVLAAVALVSGCKDKQLEAALESDANGFVCGKCATKFYTDRKLFPDYCPQCKQSDIQQVMGFACPVDKHATLASRNRGARRCEKCGGATSGISIPTEAELKAWGAVKKTKAEVGGN